VTDRELPEAPVPVEELSPKQIVAELDRYIIGQAAAKRTVAIAIRNRWRRQHLAPDMRDEVAPKNIIMIGPTGVGKTEIARRLAHLVKAPFLKVEASKYTEVGYVGRDVEGIIRDLVELGINMVRAEEAERVEVLARERAEERLLDLLLPLPDAGAPPAPSADAEAPAEPAAPFPDSTAEHRRRTRERLRQQLLRGDLDDRLVEIPVEERAIPVQVFSNVGIEQMDVDMQGLFERLMPSRTRERTVSVREARRILVQQETDKIIDRDKVVQQAVRRVEDAGIVFLDELDKIASKGSEHGPDVSRQGVQRDLLPIVEGTTVATRHGLVRTGHILFIAAGAFHMTKPGDLIPELQGRFPLRVEMTGLGRDEFVRILTEPKNALTKQYQALLATEGVTLIFESGAVERLADVAARVNASTVNIGARRLHTVMEKLLEDVSFDAPDLRGSTVQVTARTVAEKLEGIMKDEDLSRYIL
jgi:ATP-dependent HslUV protease ATP-binding subunit HslU